MYRSWKSEPGDDTTAYWPAVADMATATCVMLVIFWIAGTWSLQKERLRHSETRRELDSIGEKNSGLEELIRKLRSDLVKLENLVASATTDKDLVTALRGQVEKLENEVALKGRHIASLEERLGRSKDGERLMADNQKLERDLAALMEDLERTRDALARLANLHQEPPNIVLSEGANYTFPSGKAVVSPDFAKRFRSNELDKIVEALNSPARVELVEIVGHTDRNPVDRGASNLDSQLGNVFAGSVGVENLRPGSNADLGMARAVAVKELIVECIGEIKESNELTEDGRSRLDKLKYRTYSAAHLFPVDESSVIPAIESSGVLENNRRIEIRFTRLKKE